MISNRNWNSKKMHQIRTKTKTKKVFQDRFIPKRNHNSDISLLKFNSVEVVSMYHTHLENTVFSETLKDKKLLNFSGEMNTKLNKLDFNVLRNRVNENRENENKIEHKNISRDPFAILDAPGLLDDFYLNLLDWSSEGILAISLEDSVYLFPDKTNGNKKLMRCDNNMDYVSSLSFENNGVYLALGTSYNSIMIYDTHARRKTRIINSNGARVGSLCWNKNMLTSGARDGLIINHDMRMKKTIINSVLSHTNEVCGLKWSPDFNELASGGNDNMLKIWDIRKFDKPKIIFDQHKAAVKAISWCPTNKNILASGGGTEDKSLKLWDVSKSICLNSVNTGSQVCSVTWSKHGDEFVTSHGFSENQLTVWKFPELKQVSKLLGHTCRVIHVAQSPDGTTICSGASDETLRLWKIFEPVKSSIKSNSLSIMNMEIR